MEASQVDDPNIGELRAEIRHLHGELAMSHNVVRLLLREVEALREWRQASELPDKAWISTVFDEV
jgi:hypothetical protein